MTSQTAQLLDQAKELLVNTYATQPIVLESGKGCRVTDRDGREYLDFAAGIAVASLGHAAPVITQVLREQAEKLIVAPPSYITREKIDCARIIIENSCFDQVFFTNSGTEAIEACIKTARKWAYDNKGQECNEIISFRKSFHGRSYGAGSLTEKRHSQPYFAPYVPGVQFAEFNDLESVKKLVTPKTCAIFIEPVQGEGGIIVAETPFLRGLRALCDEQKIALVFDEVQTGFGRTGRGFAYEHMGIEPDIAALAKGMGGGFPVGAMAAKKQFAAALTVGTHGSTYAGNPLATAVAAAVMGQIFAPGFMDGIQKNAAHFMERLSAVQRTTNKISAVRGLGLMVGVDATVDIKKLLRGLQQNGLLATQAGEATLRLTPPLIVTTAEIDEATGILEKTLRAVA
ncbi:MAG TPA: acetylornithine/succinylornithine family transaminase [Patescibacteria group bacterium]|nr:acetylornithine/succinylornithine family transaminase [Patescibacteria group bacterium]